MNGSSIKYRYHFHYIASVWIDRCLQYLYQWQTDTFVVVAILSDQVGKHAHTSSIMAPSESDIRKLLTSTSYSPTLVQPLEEYLDAQFHGKAPYYFDAVRTLMKLYQLFPEYSTEEVQARAYLLALLEYPKTDLLALSYMIPQAVLNKEPCATMQKCAQHLNSCHFDKFWEVYGNWTNEAAFQVPLPRAESRLQQAILQVLSLSYKEAPISVVQKALNLSDSASIPASDVVEKVEERDGRNLVLFVATPDNTKRQRVYQEGISFHTISNLLQKIAQ